MSAPTASRSETIDAMEDAWDQAGYSYPSALSAGGAPTIRDFASIVYDEAVAEGVSPELVFVQAMKETGWLRFGGDVTVSQYTSPASARSAAVRRAPPSRTCAPASVPRSSTCAPTRTPR